MDSSLDKLLEDGLIDEVHARLMSGKEASVYIVERQGALVAAKVYKSREQRTFKATASYTEGRNQTRNTRDKRAMRKGTNYGKALIERSWRDMEFEALSDAFHAGVRVPEPILLYEDVLLMQLLVDEEGRPAPRLADFELSAEVAALLHEEIYGQVRLLLSCGRIHGDLSAFNILIAQDGPTIIDMPQVVDAAANTSAKEILRRDLANITEHLATYDARLLRFRDCGAPLFDAWQRGRLHDVDKPQEGNIRSDTHHRSRRVRDAERGRVGRGGQRQEHGPPGQRAEQPRPERPAGERGPGPRRDEHHRDHDQQRGPGPRRDEHPRQVPRGDHDQERGSGPRPPRPPPRSPSGPASGPSSRSPSGPPSGPPPRSPSGPPPGRPPPQRPPDARRDDGPRPSGPGPGTPQRPPSPGQRRPPRDDRPWPRDRKPPPAIERIPPRAPRDRGDS